MGFASSQAAFAAAFAALCAMPVLGAFDEDAFFRSGPDFVAARYAASIARCKQGVRDDCVRLSRRMGLVSTNAERDMFDAGLKGGCEKGLPEACGAIAWRRPVRKDQRLGDVAVAKKDIESACAAGDGISCARLANILSRGAAGVPADRVRARALATESCAKMGGWPCYVLAEMKVKDGENKERDDNDVQLRAKACDEGDGHACLGLGKMLADSDAARAAVLYRKGCDLEFHEACSHLGQALRDGKGVARDAARGIAQIELGCGLGDAKACDDRAAETKQYERYCALWGASACYEAALSLGREGREAAQSAEKLVALTMKAVRRGNEEGLAMAERLFKDNERACNVDRRKAEACAVAGLAYLATWPGQDYFATTPEARKGRALSYLRHACAAGAANMCAKADAVQAAPAK